MMPGKGQQRSPGATAMFYTTVAGVEEVRTGMLLKSPPSHCFKSLVNEPKDQQGTACTPTFIECCTFHVIIPRRIWHAEDHEKSWKHRFFVLFKTNSDTHLLKYFRSEDEREKVLGGIDITKSVSVQTSPHQHSKWEWIQKTFKCPASCVLFIGTEGREYFLIAENRTSVEGWYKDILKAVNNLSSQHTSPQEVLQVPSTFVAQTMDCITHRTTPNTRKPHTFSEPPMPQCYQPVFVRHNTLPNSLFSSQEPTPTFHTKRVDEQPSYYVTPRDVLKVISQENDDEEDNVQEDSFYMKMESLTKIVTESIYENVELEKKAKNEQQQMPIVIVTKTLNTQKTEMNDKNQSNEEKSPLPDRSSAGSLDSGCLYSGASSSSLTDDTSDHQIDGAFEELKFQEDPFTSEETALEEKEIILDQVELRQHLKLKEIDGRPCVTQWTAPPESTCKFHHGDRVLAVNDLETSSVQEVEIYLCKLLKRKVRLTVQRLPGSKSFHTDHCSCD